MTRDQLQPVDALIIGAGPAGVAAALHLAQYLYSAVVFDSREHSKHSYKAHLVPTWDQRSVTEMCKAAKREITGNYSSVRFEQTTIKLISKAEGGEFIVTSENGRQWLGRTVVLAVGVQYLLPDFPGYEECWKNGNCQCSMWGGRSRDPQLSAAGVLAIGEDMTAQRAMEDATIARRFVTDVTIYTDGAEEMADAIERLAQPHAGISVDRRCIERLSKPKGAASVTLYFADGSSSKQRYLAHTPKAELDGPFARQLSLELTEEGNIRTDYFQTSTPGIFAAGDCITVDRTLLNAMASGTAAATRVSAYLQQRLAAGK